MKITDAQIHLWQGENAPLHHWRTPFTINDALREMDGAGIERAINCPPGWDANANSYADEAAKRHPDRFATMGSFPLDHTANEATIDRWMEKSGMLGLRFVLATPELWPRVVGGELDWLFEAAEKRNIPFGLMAPPQHAGHLCLLADTFPDLRMVIDHMGVSPFDKLPDAVAHLDALLTLARYPNIAIKATALLVCRIKIIPLAIPLLCLKPCSTNLAHNVCFGAVIIHVCHVL